jgi:hypothetical protein
VQVTKLLKAINTKSSTAFVVIFIYKLILIY